MFLVFNRIKKLKHKFHNFIKQLIHHKIKKKIINTKETTLSYQIVQILNDVFNHKRNTAISIRIPS